MRLKGACGAADIKTVDAAKRMDILDRYQGHARRFEEAAARRKAAAPVLSAVPAPGDVIPLINNGIGRPPEIAPTARELEVLQLIADGLANREIGGRLFLSEETIKSHVRHLLAKLHARSRAHAVAVGLRRGLVE
jgi:DNA-binding NarL/FixJ family response regulator